MWNYQGVMYINFPFIDYYVPMMFLNLLFSVLTQAKGTPLHLSKGCDEAHEVTPWWHIQIPKRHLSGLNTGICHRNGTKSDSTHGGLSPEQNTQSPSANSSKSRKSLAFVHFILPNSPTFRGFRGARCHIPRSLCATQSAQWVAAARSAGSVGRRRLQRRPQQGLEMPWWNMIKAYDNQLIDGLSWFIPLFIGFQPSKVVQDFFHPQ